MSRALSRLTRLSLCPLDHRVVPAVVLTTLDLDGDGSADDVRIVGDARNSKVTVQDNGANTLTIAIDANGDGDLTDLGDSIAVPHIFNGDSVTLDLNLGGGNDTVEYTATGNLSASTRVLGINLGAGSDKLLFGTGTNDILNACRVFLDVTAGGGADMVGIQFDEVRQSLVDITADLGLGADTYNLAFDRIDDGAAVTVHTELGAGPNTYTADFQEIGFGDRGAVDMTVVGGNQADTVRVNMHDDVGDGTKASRFAAVADLLGGNDTFQSAFDLGGSVFRVDDQSQCSLVVLGGAGNDTLSAAGTGSTGTIRIDPNGLLSLDLDGGAGNDTLITHFGAPDALELIGLMRIRMDGGLGDDHLTCLLANNANTTGSFDVAVRGGAGNDPMIFSEANDGGAPAFGPTGKVQLDGGTGVDTLTNAAKAVSSGLGFELVL
jgi:hypothetical protein